MALGISLPAYHALNPGDTVIGEIVDFRIQQKSNYDTKRPMYLEVGEAGRTSRTFAPYAADGTANKPNTEWVFTLDIGVEDETGDTERRVFLDPRHGKRGTAVEGKRGADAVGIALKKAKAHRVGLEIGATITITRGENVRPAKGEAACRTYTVEYVPPAGGPGSGKLVDETIYLVGGDVFEDRPAVVKESGDERGDGRSSSGATTWARGAGAGAMITYEGVGVAAERSALKGIRDTQVTNDDTPPF